MLSSSELFFDFFFLISIIFSFCFFYFFISLSFFLIFSDDDFHFDSSDQPDGDSRPLDLQSFKVSKHENGNENEKENETGKWERKIDEKIIREEDWRMEKRIKWKEQKRKREKDW